MFPTFVLDMTKKEQQKFTTDAIGGVKERGFTVGFFLKSIGISRSHWHFIKKGERPLTNDNKKKVESFLK